MAGLRAIGKLPRTPGNPSTPDNVATGAASLLPEGSSSESRGIEANRDYNQALILGSIGIGFIAEES
jgi:hypothetical protein